MWHGGRVLELAGRGVLIAGARRVGAAVARRLAQEGMRITLTYRNSAAAAQQLAAELEPLAGPVTLASGDLADEAAAAAVTAAAGRGMGNLFAVVNLASDYRRTPFSTLDGAAWDAGMATARASYLLALHGARAMADNPGPTRGHLVLFGDWAAHQTPYRDYLPYLTAKAAVGFMTRAFAAELAPQGILVNAIAPGPTLRPPDITPGDWQREVLARTPLGREAAAEDIAELVATLLKSETITGEVIRVDSGRHLAGPGWTQEEPQ
jgi:NAD(P)-dependent dehydrogenase (short-subunit alcohol dehydrogenase family)